MMFTCALVLALAAAPSAGLAVGERVKVSPEKARAIVDVIAAELLVNGLPTRRLEASCAGAVDCIVQRGRAEGLEVVVVVTLGAAGADTVVDLEAHRVEGARALSHVTFKLGRALDAQQRQLLAAFAAGTTRAQPAPPPPEAAPAAAAPSAEPASPPAEASPPVPAPAEPEPVSVENPAPSERPRLAPAVTLALGGLAAVGAGVFGVLVLLDEQQLNASPDGVTSSLTRAEALSLRDSANAQRTLSLGAAVLAAGLLLAGTLWLLLSQ